MRHTMMKISEGIWEYQVGQRSFRIVKEAATAMQHAHSCHQYIAYEGYGATELWHFRDSLFTTLRSLQETLDKQAPKYRLGVGMRSYGDPAEGCKA